MRNQFAGTCYRCGQTVEAGEGHFERMPWGSAVKWRTQHAHCAITHRGEADAVTELRNKQQAALNAKRQREKAQGTGRGAQRARARLEGAEIMREAAENACATLSGDADYDTSEQAALAIRNLDPAAIIAARATP
jgi:hypothetical protein